MKSTGFLSAGGMGVVAALLSYLGHDGGGSAPSLITGLLGGGGLLSIILGFIPDGKKPIPDGGGGGGKSDNGLSLANFAEAIKLYKKSKGTDSPGGAKLTRDEVMEIFHLFAPDVAADISDDDVKQLDRSGAGLGDAAKFAQFISQLLQLKPVADAFKAKGGWPAYTEILLIWDAETVVPVRFGTDPRKPAIETAVAAKVA